MNIPQHSHSEAKFTTLSPQDLIPDEPLKSSGKRRIPDSEDLLRHRVIATRIAELAAVSNGQVNIGLFAPWGAGKSSFNALLREELQSIDKSIGHVTYDAWKNAGDGFQANFLHAFGSQVSGANSDIAEKLFDETASVGSPQQSNGKGKQFFKRPIVLALSALLFFFFLLPLIWTCIGAILTKQGDFLPAWRENFFGFSMLAGSWTLFTSVVIAILQLTKVTVQRSTPSHVSQFSKLFNEIVSQGKASKFVIFIDELDRCHPDDVMKTLEGLRTFLGHKKCVFVVAFDREAVAATIATQTERNVPNSPSVPYYQTSGEYLDKIFQFQISLPPQPTHTFRRMANSLVQEKRGVWGELRSDDSLRFERVITLLSPMHLRSPRRTKVLLNDFAVNARIFESLGFDWVRRAEEIAVLTVLQTEFPRLAADLEREPALIQFLLHKSVPNRPELQELVAQYGQNDNSDQFEADGKVLPLDSIVGKTEGGITASVVAGLQRDLRRYLRRLTDMDADIPMADLVMMHSDQALLSFDDPGVYNELQIAADSPRSDVVSALANASVTDQSRAVDYLLREAENESDDIANGLRILVGEIVAEHIEPGGVQASNMLAGLQRISQPISADAVRGYGKALVASFNMPAMEWLFNRVEESEMGAVADALAQLLIRELGQIEWDTTRVRIADVVFRDPVVMMESVSAYVVRVGGSQIGKLGISRVNSLISALTVETAGDLENEEASLDAASKREAADALVRQWHELPLSSPVRSELLLVLRSAPDAENHYLELHDKLIGESLSNGHAEEANHWLLEAIAQKPQWAAARWANLLSQEATVEPGIKKAALEMVVRRGIAGKENAIRENAANNARRVALVPSSAINLDGLIAELAEHCAEDWEEYSDNRLEFEIRMLGALEQATELAGGRIAQIRGDVVFAAVVAAQNDDASVRELTGIVESFSGAEAQMLAERVLGFEPWASGNPNVGIEMLLRAQLVAQQAGVVVTPIPGVHLDAIEGERGQRELGPMWIATRPTANEVKRFTFANSLDPATWRDYGKSLNAQDRGVIWEWMRTSTSLTNRTTKMEAICAAGAPMQVFESAMDRLVSASTVTARGLSADEYLTLPAGKKSSSLARTAVLSMASDSKQSEVGIGVRILRHYSSFITQGQAKQMRPAIEDWMRKGNKHLPKKDKEWLIGKGFIQDKMSVLSRLVKR